AVIEPHLPPPARYGRTRKTKLRDVVDAIFYIGPAIWSALQFRAQTALSRAIAHRVK
ncbi:MAG: hypothetical protein B7Z71_13300, partial [Acidocella sp. 21-58-7]